MLMVRAGAVVDEFIKQLLPLLDKGDIIIDGGNANYPDSTRRTRELAERHPFCGCRRVGGGKRARATALRLCPAAMKKPGLM